jgi:hypothetical protein
MSKEIETFKLQIRPQITKLVVKKENELQEKLHNETIKSAEFSSKLDSMRSDYEMKLHHLKTEND